MLTNTPQPDTVYPAERCRENRARCMEQARKRKAAGRPRTDVMEWVGNALFWHVRVTRPGLTWGETMDATAARAVSLNRRTAAAVEATRAAAVAGMNPPKAAAFVPATAVTGGVA